MILLRRVHTGPIRNIDVGLNNIMLTCIYILMVSPDWKSIYDKYVAHIDIRNVRPAQKAHLWTREMLCHCSCLLLFIALSLSSLLAFFVLFIVNCAPPFFYHQLLMWYDCSVSLLSIFFSFHFFSSSFCFGQCMPITAKQHGTVDVGHTSILSLACLIDFRYRQYRWMNFRTSKIELRAI